MRAARASAQLCKIWVRYIRAANECLRGFPQETWGPPCTGLSLCVRMLSHMVTSEYTRTQNLAPNNSQDLSPRALSDRADSRAGVGVSTHCPAHAWYVLHLERLIAHTQVSNSHYTCTPPASNAVPFRGFRVAATSCHMARRWRCSGL